VIGIIPRTDQVAAVEEFFELFKTPWEFYRPGGAYEIVLATADEVPDTDARLLLVYGATTKGIDARLGITAGERRHHGVLNDANGAVPIYGDLLSFAGSGSGTVCVEASSGIAGVRAGSSGSVVVRLGYDLFDEIRLLLSEGQPPEYAGIPTLELHVALLRKWILEAGISFFEILPAPANYSFIACLTHDIDFVGIRRHFFDHTMWGFAYRATVGALLKFAKGELSLARLFRSWLATASLPFVYAGWVRDFWEPFEWYSEVEKGLPATYFLIPFKRRAGEKVPGPHALRRATAYDIGDLPDRTAALLRQGCEIGVHGIDSWHSVDRGREELSRAAAIARESGIGIRMHWLLRDTQTDCVLERAGFVYDSTFGYNETIGYRAGTGQVYRPLGAQTLLELPLHIQDGALFYPQRLNLSEAEAEKRCRALIDNARSFGGVLTLLWHDRSHGPERFWGDFYVKLLGVLKSSDAWFGTAGQVVGWFRKRREVRFERVGIPGGTRTRIRYEGGEIQPPLQVRVHAPQAGPSDEFAGSTNREVIDIPWDGKSVDELELQMAARFSGTLPGIASCALS
jgi:hypothetical protein